MVVGNKRGNENTSQAMVFDIEGTTTSISFVKDTLFPYVRQNLKEFVERQWNETEFHSVLSLLKDQSKQDEANKIDGVVVIPEEGSDVEVQEAVVNNVLWQMDGDLKNKALKKLQGHIMREGYKKGELKGHVYPDVVPALKSWVQNGSKLYVYSSGSVEAQKLLFGHSQEGDLLELFQGHFDTEVGAKTEARSYTNIMEQLEYQADDVVFFTDIPKEAIAAEEAGMTAVLVVREGNTPLTEDDRARFQVIDTFEDFEREAPTKRRKVSIEENVSVSDENGKAAVDDAPKEVIDGETEKASVVIEDVKDVKENEKTPEDVPVVEETKEAAKEVENSTADVEDVEMKDVSEATLPKIDEKGEEKEEVKTSDSAVVLEEEKPVTETAKIDSENAEMAVEEPEKMEDASEIKDCKTDSEINVTEVAAPVVETPVDEKAVGDTPVDEKAAVETPVDEKAVVETPVDEKAVDDAESVKTVEDPKTEEVAESIEMKSESIETPAELKADDKKEVADGEKVPENDSDKVDTEKVVDAEVTKEDEPVIANDEVKENNIPDEIKESVEKESDVVPEVEVAEKEVVVEKGQGDAAAADVEKPTDAAEKEGDEKPEVEVSKSGTAGEGDNAEKAVTADG